MITLDLYAIYLYKEVKKQYKISFALGKYVTLID